MVDLADPMQNLRAFLRVRSALDGSDSVCWFKGTTHAWLPGERGCGLFGFEGYNVSRVVEVEGGYDLLTREAVFYTDLGTGEILRRFANPLNEREVDVLHIWNDPVNQPMRLHGQFGPWNMPVSQAGDDLFFNADVFLAYPSPLPRAEFPENSQSDLYQAAELFQFFCKRSHVDDEANPSVPMQVSWTRLGPWLPWMAMGDRPGMLVYHGRGAKLAGGYKDLPQFVRDEVEAGGPQFAEAPREFSQPNETSWTYFRKRATAAR